MGFEQAKNAQLHVISSPQTLTGLFTASADVTASLVANAIPGVTAFAYDPQLTVAIKGKGQFGLNRPIGLVETYDGVKGSLDIEGVDGENALDAAINRMLRAGFLHGNDNRRFESFILGNVTGDDGAALSAYFIDTVKFDATPKAISGDAKKFSFQALYGLRFAGVKMRYFVITGNTTPVTAISYPTTEVPVTWTDDMGASRYAVLVLRYNSTDKTVKRLQLATAAAAGYYSETGSAVTLATADGLGASDKALVAYIM